MNLMEPIFLSLFANIIRMYAIYRCMEHFFLSKDENKISKICMYTGFVLVNSVGYYLFNNMFINISKRRGTCWYLCLHIIGFLL